MEAVVLYQSIYGNTRQVAQAIVDGIGSEAKLVRVEEYTGGTADVLVIGGPMHSGVHHLATDGTDGPVMRGWLRHMPPTRPHLAATFCTCVEDDAQPAPSACTVIADRLTRHGIEVVATESFYLAGAEGPLLAGELGRAREFGTEIAHAARTRLAYA